MAKKKNQESQMEQSKRFKKAVRDMEDAGELNPTEADAAFSKLMGNLKLPKAGSD